MTFLQKPTDRNALRKEEGQPQAPLGKEEAAFQYHRVQRGEAGQLYNRMIFGRFSMFHLVVLF